MRPSFSYLDKADNKTREREAANEGGLVYISLNRKSNLFRAQNHKWCFLQRDFTRKLGHDPVENRDS